MKDVLIIEHPKYRGVIASALKEEGLFVVESTTAVESVKELEENLYSVIIADVNIIAGLPDFWRNKLSEARWVPIILTCDISEVEETLFPIKQNIYDIVVKPYNIESIKEHVAHARSMFVKREQVKELRPLLTVEAKMTIPSRRKYFEPFIAYAVEILSAHGHHNAAAEMPLAIEEALMNALIHGNKENPDESIQCSIIIDSSRAMVTISDNGSGFNFEKVISEARSRADAVYAESGRGILLIAMHTDAFYFSDEGRTVVLIKNNK